MLPELAGRRVLVEIAGAAAARTTAEALAAAGFSVTTCDGRGAGGRGCPVLLGRRCHLVEEADAIVCGLDSAEITDAVLARAGERAAAAPSATAEAAVETVRRLRARRGRRVRRLVESGGRRLLVRAVEPGDAERLQEFDSSLSDRSRRLRYLSYMPPLSAEQAERMAAVDFDRRFAFVAIEGRGDQRRLVADARLLDDPEHPDRPDLAVVVADDLQGSGIGPLLLQLLIEVAAERGLGAVGAEVWWENKPMVHVLRRLGFERAEWELGVMTFVKRLEGPGP